MSENNPARHVIIVDTETSGLDTQRDIAVEVAWYDMTTNERGCFVPYHDVEWIRRHGDPVALKINRYWERLADAEQDVTGVQVDRLRKRLTGNTFGAANPWFDLSFVLRTLGVSVPVWHHRPADLTNYAAGRLGIPPSELPGVAEVCDRLGVVNRAPHTASGDVDATVQCFRIFMRHGQLGATGGT